MFQKKEGKSDEGEEKVSLNGDQWKVRQQGWIRNGSSKHLSKRRSHLHFWNLM